MPGTDVDFEIEAGVVRLAKMTAPERRAVKGLSIV